VFEVDMKTITSKVDLDLPLPDGRMLRAKSSALIEDHIAGSDRVETWSDAQVVLIEDYEEPEPEEVDAPKAEKTEKLKPVRAADRKTEIPPAHGRRLMEDGA